MYSSVSWESSFSHKCFGGLTQRTMFILLQNKKCIFYIVCFSTLFEISWPRRVSKKQWNTAYYLKYIVSKVWRQSFCYLFNYFQVVLCDWEVVYSVPSSPWIKSMCLAVRQRSRSLISYAITCSLYPICYWISHMWNVSLYTLTLRLL